MITKKFTQCVAMRMAAATTRDNGIKRTSVSGSGDDGGSVFLVIVKEIMQLIAVVMAATVAVTTIDTSSSVGDSDEDNYSEWSGGCVCVSCDDEVFAGFGVDICYIIFGKNNFRIVIFEHF